MEEGLRYNYGLKYSIYNPNGANISSTVGRVYRLSEQEFYDITTGFPKKSSDIVAGWQSAKPNSTSHAVIDYVCSNKGILL